MEKVQKPRNSECDTPLSEPFGTKFRDVSEEHIASIFRFAEFPPTPQDGNRPDDGKSPKTQ
jgi:hypothetical protein